MFKLADFLWHIWDDNTVPGFYCYYASELIVS